mmetsp:Transcript_6408/g.16340  ORF Transcript_6408/g.16340 Transcript_6408/m.16340 type:complete len:276 (-) Transcript_6408:583-1410(-)
MSGMMLRINAWSSTSEVKICTPNVGMAMHPMVITAPTQRLMPISSQAMRLTRAGRRPWSRAMKLVAATNRGSTKYVRVQKICSATWCAAMVSVPSASAVMVIIVYTPMRHREPSSSMPLMAVMSRISCMVGSRQSAHCSGSMPRRLSTTRNTTALMYCAASVAHAAPASPMFKPALVTAKMSPKTFTTPAMRKMSSGVRASCCPRHPPCAEVQNSTAGMAKARMRRYGCAAVIRSGEHPIAASTWTLNRLRNRHVNPPKMTARMMEFASARRTVG